MGGSRDPLDIEARRRAKTLYLPTGKPQMAIFVS